MSENKTDDLLDKIAKILAEKLSLKEENKKLKEQIRELEEKLAKYRKTSFRQAERQLRPAVISRKLSCANKTEKGKQTWEVLTNITFSLHQQGRIL